MIDGEMHGQAMASDLAECAAVLGRARRLLVITGAGISAESGMPTYRGPQGEYMASPGLPDIMSADAFGKDRERVWRYVDRLRMLAGSCIPNSAHRTLAKWEHENRFGGLLVATQNIDGLHQKAGSKRVSGIHGSLWQMAKPRGVDYTDDGQFSDDVRFMGDPEMRDEILQRWSEENHQVTWEDREVPFRRIPPYDEAGVRPNITLYDESYGSRLVWVEDFIRGKVDVVVVIGCSGGVTVLDLLLRRCRDSNPNCEFININPHEDCMKLPHRHLPMAATAALEALDIMLAETRD
jgi:NAD-dependent SIR2 family protein deacetylase